jgi:integrase
MKHNFTEAYIRKLDPPTEGDRYYVYDTGQPGLCLMATATGRKTFYIYRRLRGGKPVRVKGPAFPSTGVDAARAWAREELGKLDRGVDPNAELRARRNQVTLADAWDDYLEKHSKPHCRPSTQREDLRIFDKHLKDGLARRVLSEIATREIADLHVTITKENGPRMANVVFNVIRKVFNHARLKMGCKQIPNPCDKEVVLNKEHDRERVLDKAEKKRLRTAIDNEPDAELVDYIRLLAETGQRKTNVATMRWAHVDLTKGVWLIPGSETKNGKPLNLGLTTIALDVLKRRADAEDADGEFVFHRKTFTEGWKRIRAAAKLEDIRYHDLRRTVGTDLAEAGASEFVIAKALGHASTRSTHVYVRISDDRAKDALQSLSGSILGDGKPKTKRKRAG